MGDYRENVQVSQPNVWLENVICVIHCFVLLASNLFFCLLSVCLSNCLSVCLFDILSVCLSVSVDGQTVSLFNQRVSSQNLCVIQRDVEYVL